MTHSTPCCWSAIKRIGSRNNRNIKPNDVASVSPAKVLPVSRKKSLSIQRLSLPERCFLPIPDVAEEGQLAASLSFDSSSVGCTHARAHPCATPAHAAITHISEYLCSPSANSWHPQFQHGPAAPHLPYVLAGLFASHALRGARRLTLSLPKTSGKMHQFDSLFWISISVAQGQRAAQCLAGGWMVTALSGCFCL